MISPEQEQFINSLKFILHHRPFIQPELPGPCSVPLIGALRQWCYDVVTWDGNLPYQGGYFDVGVSVLIYLNVLVMSSSVWLAPHNALDPYRTASYAAGSYMIVEGNSQAGYLDDLENALDIANIVFASLFIIEAAMKLMAFGVRQYFNSSWNRFDFTLVVASILGIIIDMVQGAFPINAQLIRVLRCIRAARLLRNLQNWKSVMQLLETILYSLPAILNVVGLMLLLLYIYAMVGMELFGRIEHGSGSYGLLNGHAHFQTFDRAVVTLFRMTTGESWNGIMHDCMEAYPMAWLYFLSWLFLGSYLMLNLIIAIVIDQFTMIIQQADQPIQSHHIIQFTYEWYHRDPKGELLLHICDIADALLDVEAPLGLRNSVQFPEFTGFAPEKRASVKKDVARLLLSEFEMPHIDHHIHWRQMEGGKENGPEFHCHYHEEHEGLDQLVHFVECFTALVRHVHNQEVMQDLDRMEHTDIKELKGIATTIARAYPSIYEVETDVVSEVAMEHSLRGEERSTAVDYWQKIAELERHVEDVHMAMCEDRFEQAWVVVSGEEEVDAEQVVIGVDKPTLLSILPPLGEEGTMLPEQVLSEINTQVGTLIQEAEFKTFMWGIFMAAARQTREDAEAVILVFDWLDLLEHAIVASGCRDQLCRSAVMTPRGRQSPSRRPMESPRGDSPVSDMSLSPTEIAPPGIIDGTHARETAEHAGQESSGSVIELEVKSCQIGDRALMFQTVGHSPVLTLGLIVICICRLKWPSLQYNLPPTIPS